MATLAELTAQMIALQGQQQSYRNTIVGNLTAMRNQAPPSYFSSSAQAAARANYQRLASWGDSIAAGSPVPLSEIDQFNTSASLNPDWIYFGPAPNYSGLSGTQIGGMNAQLRNQYRTQYESFLTMDQQIASLQQQIAAMQNQGSGQAGSGTGGGGTPPPQTPPPQTPPPSPAEPAETRNTQRADRRRLQVAFGSPRFGVGLNIPLGT